MCGLYPLGEKTCTRCDEAKRPWEFPRDARLPHGLSSLCKPCAQVKNRASYAKFIDRRRAAAAEYRTPEVLDRYRAASAKWRRENPEQDAFNRRASKARRRAAEQSVLHIPYSRTQLEARIAYFGGLCWMCGIPYDHMDHVKPIMKGGANILANLRPACSSCNISKKDKWYGVEGLHRFIK